MLWVETLPSISLLYPYSPYEYINETITGFPSQGHDYWASYWLIGWPAALLCLHLVNQSVPEPWWYYYSAYSMSQVPEQWVTSNDPYVTTVTTTTPVTTTSTTTTTTTAVTSVTTSTVTVTSTSTSTFTTTVYRYVTSAGDIAAAVVVTAVVVALAVWAVRRK